ncbi:MAG: DUF1131 family protein [Desulfuromonadaceae bacterium]
MKIYLWVILVVGWIGSASANNIPVSNAITISEKGVGPINGKTPFSQKEVQKLLPKLEVAQVSSMTEGEEFPILEVSDKKGLLFTINPDSNAKLIYSIVVGKDRVTNSLGHRTGQSYKEVYGGFPAECVAGEEERSGTVFCLAPKSRHIGYQFASKKGDSLDGEVPQLKMLNTWIIKSVFWQP